MVSTTTLTNPGTVEHEAARLDRLFPGWHQRVDVATLSLASTTGCILGQIGGFFVLWPDVLRDSMANDTRTYTNLYCYPEHEFEWVQEIEKRCN